MARSNTAQQEPPMTRFPRMPAGPALLTAATLAAASPGHAEGRFPTIPPADYTPAQKQAAADFLAARKAPVFGPFEPLMYSPEVMTLARSMGDYLRFKSGIGTTLSELVILITAREWSQDFEWSFHKPIALKAGVPAAVVDALEDGRRPETMSADEAIVYDATTELHRNHRLSDATFNRAVARFGRPAVVDMIGVAGYYTFLAMQLNAAQYKVPEGAALPRFP